MSPHPDRASVMRRAEGGASAAAPALLAVGFESPRAGLREAEALGFGFLGMASGGEVDYNSLAALALAKEFEPLSGVASPEAAPELHYVILPFSV